MDSVREIWMEKLTGIQMERLRPMGLLMVIPMVTPTAREKEIQTGIRTARWKEKLTD